MASLAAVRTWQHGALFLPAVKTGPDSHNGTVEYFRRLAVFSAASSQPVRLLTCDSSL